MATDTGTASNGGKTWQFTLRDGMKWENGNPVTCADVAYGVSRQFDIGLTEGGPVYAVSYLDIPTDEEGNSAYAGPADGTGQELFDKAVVCDGNTITFNLNQPVPDFNYAVTLGFSAVPADMAAGVEYGDKPMSNGPYKISEYAKGKGGKLVLVRNEAWSADSDPYRKAYPDSWVVNFGIEESVADQRVIQSSGEDEFAILLTALERADDAAVVAAKIVSELCKPYLDLDGHDIQASPSIGVALFPRDGHDTDALCRNADAAMYQSKRAGRGRYTFYDASLNPADARLFNLAQRLPRAIAEDELVLHFQPKVNLSDYQISGFEALVRWQHPELGLIYPNDFIPLAERTGAILELGDWVAEACCRQLASWREEGQRLVPIAFNVSAIQLHDSELPDRIAQLLARYQLDGTLLQVEITETCLVESMDVANTVLNQLEQLGIHIALDDYGSGFSSLAYVRTLPIHCLKIDRGFIHDIRNSPDDAVIVSSIITLAHNLKMCVVAEGVELVDQLVHLKTAGCDQVQGYFFSRPVPADQASELLSRPSLAPT